MGLRFNKPSFASGEISPQARARVDQERIVTGMRYCRNTRVLPEGGFAMRPGLVHIDAALYPDNPTRLIPFERSASVSYGLELGEFTDNQLYMRVLDGDSFVICSPGDVAQSFPIADSDSGGTYTWTDSGTVPGEWYENVVAGSTFAYLNPEVIQIVDTQSMIDFADGTVTVVTIIETLTLGTLGSLNAGEFAFGDNDTIGSDHFYVKTTAGGDPSTTTKYPVVCAQLRLPWGAGTANIDPFEIQFDQQGDWIFTAHTGMHPGLLKRVEEDYWTYEDVPFNATATAPQTFLSTIRNASVTTEDHVYQYAVTSVDKEGFESKKNILALSVDEYPTPGTTDIELLWDIDIHTLEELSIVVSLTSVDWILSTDYMTSGLAEVFFATQTGTGTNNITDPMVPPLWFEDSHAKAPAGLAIVDAAYTPVSGSKDPLKRTHRRQAGGLFGTEAWGWGTIRDFRPASTTPDFSGPTLWHHSLPGAFPGSEVDIRDLTGDFHIYLEKAAGYNVYRRVGRDASADGFYDGSTWSPWGLLAALDANGGFVVAYGAAVGVGHNSDDLTHVKGFFTDLGEITLDESQAPPEDITVFDEAGDYPAAVGFFGQRLVYGGTLNDPSKIWFSESGNFFNFTIGDVVGGTSPMERLLTSANPIQSFADSESLLAFTDGGEWRIWGDGGVVSAETLNAVQAGENGIYKVAPLKVDNVIIYPQALGFGVMAVRYSNETNGFVSSELSAFSRNLLKDSEIASWGYEGKPNSVVHAARADGNMIGVTIDQSQAMNAWHLHSTGEDHSDSIEDVIVIRKGRQHWVYVVVRREVGSGSSFVDTRYIERFDFRDLTDPTMMRFLDSSLTYSSPSVPFTDVNNTADDPFYVTAASGVFVAGDEVLLATLAPDSGVAFPTSGDFVGRRCKVLSVSGGTDYYLGDMESGAAFNTSDPWPTGTWSGTLRALVNTISGLDHLEAREVEVLGDGQDFGTYQMAATETSITLLDYVTDAVVGLHINAYGELLNFDGGAGAETLVGASKAIDAITLHTIDTYAIAGSVDGDEATAYEYKAASNNPDTMPSEFENIIELDATGEWTDHGRVRLSNVGPLPFTVLSVTPRYTLEQEDQESE